MQNALMVHPIMIPSFILSGLSFNSDSLGSTDVRGGSFGSFSVIKEKSTEAVLLKNCQT